VCNGIGIGIIGGTIAWLIFSAAQSYIRLRSGGLSKRVGLESLIYIDYANPILSALMNPMINNAGQYHPLQSIMF
jgi:hypothetical protein